MKILVTGASGFIGKHVLKVLEPLEHEVVATTTNIAKAEKQNLNESVRFIELDLNRFESGENYFTKLGSPDLLIHLAWQGLPNYKSLFHVEENLPLHYHFLKNMVTNGLENISVTGTCFEYGMKEGCLSEEMCTEPGNPYALAKDSLRKFLQELQKFNSFKLKWIRLFYMYGDGQNPNSLLSQLELALSKGDEAFNMSGGEQLRDYLPVDIVADYLVKIVTQNEVTDIINCCSGQPIKVIDLVRDYILNRDGAREIKLNTGYYAYPDYEPMAFWGDNTKLKTILTDE